VASLAWWIAPRRHNPGGDTEWTKCGWIYKEHWTTGCPEDGSCGVVTRRQLKKVVSL